MKYILNCFKKKKKCIYFLFDKGSYQFELLEFRGLGLKLDMDYEKYLKGFFIRNLKKKNCQLNVDQMVGKNYYYLPHLGSKLTINMLVPWDSTIMTIVIYKLYLKLKFFILKI